MQVDPLECGGLPSNQQRRSCAKHSNSHDSMSTERQRMMSDTATEHPVRYEPLERIGGSLVNIVLGAVILWVGQTTFHHAGLLASVNKQFDNVENQFGAVSSRHDLLRQRVEEIQTDIQIRTSSRFKREDGEKLDTRIREIADRLTSVQLKVMALESQRHSQQEVATLRAELARLRFALAELDGARQLSAKPIATSANATYVHPQASLR